MRVEKQRIFIDDKPALIFSGEIHYFRLPEEQWQDRLDKLKAAGCNSVATYIPWLCHALPEGGFDMDGSTRPELNLGAFIDLCRDNGLWFIARPGPYVMAELKNEGLPHDLLQQHPEIRLSGWDGKATTTAAVDYLSPAFLDAARLWYEAVMPILAARQAGRGGNVIALQLDNEVGMLSWLNNSPDLGDQALTEFAAWLVRRYPSEILSKRYPFIFEDTQCFMRQVRSPESVYATALRLDLGDFFRFRHARYLNTLAGWVKESDMPDLPLMINVHGTAGGRGLTFPVGISQLYDAFAIPSVALLGADYYLGNLTHDNFQDLYLCNAILKAMAGQNKTQGTLEFECGDGNYDNNYGNRLDPSAADFKLRMCVAQGQRLINFYLFAGGYNFRHPQAPRDGDRRIAITGERHGAAAPINPEGTPNYTYPPLTSSIKALAVAAGKLAQMEEEHDRLVYGFIPDYYMTEHYYPGDSGTAETIRFLEVWRGQDAWENLMRAVLHAGFRFGAEDLQRRLPDIEETPVLVLPSARYMPEKVQSRLLVWLESGGRLLLYGEVPWMDMEGKSCTLLMDALGIVMEKKALRSERHSIALVAEGWAAPRPEINTWCAQIFRLPENATSLMRVYEDDACCAFDIEIGKGRAVVFAAPYVCDIDLFRLTLEKLGCRPGLRHDHPEPGLFMTSSRSGQSERFIHLLNLDGFEKTFHLYDHDEPLFGGNRINLRPRAACMLPLSVAILPDVRICYATVELVRIEDGVLTFRSAPGAVVAIELKAARTLQAPEGCSVSRHENEWHVRVTDNKGDELSLLID